MAPARVLKRVDEAARMSNETRFGFVARAALQAIRARSVPKRVVGWPSAQRFVEPQTSQTGQRLIARCQARDAAGRRRLIALTAPRCHLP
jgi:hypothetical protein